MKHKCENTKKISLSASWQYSCQMYTYSWKPRHSWRPPQSTLNLQQDRGQSLEYVSLWHYPFIKKQRHYFANKGPSSQGYGFSRSHVWMWELDSKESWALKNWCFQTVVLEKTLETPLDCKEIQPVQPKGNQSWIFIGRTNAEVDTPILWPPNSKRPWFWKRLKVGGEGDDRGWDGWMASLTQWTWVWVNSGSWWWTGRPGVLQSMGWQRVGHDWATELMALSLNLSHLDGHGSPYFPNLTFPKQFAEE